MLKNFFNKQKKEVATVKTLNGNRIYAIGDIHGRVDLLRKIHKEIIKDSENFSADKKTIVYMGDYIDRGFRSKEVLDEIITNKLEGFETVYLKGNHEYAILGFLKEPKFMASWIGWGGDACLRSYDIKLRCDEQSKLKSPEILSKELAIKIPAEHREFLNNLETYYQNGDYLFVHAGLRPGVSLDKQETEDMLMIRDQFIYSNYDFGKTIVFGHTVFEKPYQAKGRIGIDTGAYASGVLTCAILEDNQVRFITS